MSKNAIWVLGLLILLILTVIPSKASDKCIDTFDSQVHFMMSKNQIKTKYNRYFPDGNSSVLVALDSSLLGEGNYFNNEIFAREVFKNWLKPFEEKFDLSFHLKNVTTFIPGKHDNLTISLIKVTQELSWNLATSVDDENVEGNGFDWLIIYQEHYKGGRNQVNALRGNALIIAHNQLIFNRQLILLHEVGHLFGGAHDANGDVYEDWYGKETYSIMDYEDLIELEDIWDGVSLPIDEHNFETINATKYRFDLKDPELDGLPNYYEYRYAFDPTINDSYEDFDNDGMNNLEEYQYGTNPDNIDSDEDGFSDWAEKYLQTSPMNSSEVPEVNNPIILPWTKQTTINEKEKFLITWRGISSNPNSFEIYQNDSLQQRTLWTSELIQYQLENPTPGFWNFTCLVVDGDGDKSAAEIWIQVRSVNDAPLIILGPLIGMICLTLVYKKRIEN